MAYNPIQLPMAQPGAGMGEFVADLLSRARRAEDERNQQRARNLLAQRNTDIQERYAQSAEERAKRQEMQSRAEMLPKLQKLAETNPQMAAEMGRAYGLNLSAEAMYGAAPQAQEAAPMAQPAPKGPYTGPGWGPTEDELFGGDPRSVNELMQAATGGGGGAAPGDAVDQALTGFGKTAQATGDPNVDRARKLLGYRLVMQGQGGPTTLYDPVQERQAAEEARAARAQQIGQALGPEMGEQAQALIDAGLDPQKVVAALQAQQEKAGGRAFTAEENQKNRDAALARARLMANRPVSPGQRADDRRADVTAFGTDYSRWESSKNLDKLNDAYDKFSEMKANMDDYRKADDVIGLRSALYQTARYITGPGVLTPQEYENTVAATSGLAASALTKLKKGLDGKISPQESAALEKFVANADSAIRRRAARAVSNFDTKYGESYWTRQVPGEVQAQRSALMQRFGLTERDLRNEDASERDRRKARAVKTGGKAPTGGDEALLDELTSIMGP